VISRMGDNQGGTANVDSSLRPNGLRDLLFQPGGQYYEDNQDQ